MRSPKGRKHAAGGRARRQWRRYDCQLVELTGGEPLLQKEAIPLMERLLARATTVMLETGGHRSIERVPRAVIKIVDVKCPGSGEAAPHALGEPRSPRAARRGEVRHQGPRRLRVRARRRAPASTSAARGGGDCSRRSTACWSRGAVAEWILADHLPRAPAVAAAQIHLGADARVAF